MKGDRQVLLPAFVAPLSVFGLAFGLSSLLLLPTLLGAQALPDSALYSRIEALSREGDRAGAIRILRPALQVEPENPTLLCHMAELLADSSEITARQSPQAAKPLLEEAVIHARNATRVKPEKAAGWFHLGRTLGDLSQLPGGWETVEMGKEARESFERALALDPDHPGALHGLGVWHREVASLPGPMRLAARVFLPSASNSESAEFFRRAIRVEPQRILHHLELARTLLAMGEPGQARTELETVLRLPEAGPADEEGKREAAFLLESIRR